MGLGIDTARAAGAGAHADLLEAIKESLLIVFLAKLGGEADVSVRELDSVSQQLMYLSVDSNGLHFSLRKKQ